MKIESRKRKLKNLLIKGAFYLIFLIILVILLNFAGKVGEKKECEYWTKRLVKREVERLADWQIEQCKTLKILK